MIKAEFPPVTALFSNLTASQSISYGTSKVTLGGTVSAAGAYPTNGEIIMVAINGNTQTTAINDSTGDFSINYNSSTLPASATPYPINYSYAGDGALYPATNTSTTLTVNPTPVAATISLSSNGVVSISFVGEPFQTYLVQTATNLAGPWQPLSTNTAGSNGSWLFTSPNAANAQQFYNASLQP